MSGRSGRSLSVPIILAYLVLTGSTLAGQPATPDYEVKLFLDPAKVLSEGDEPRQSVRDVFHLQGSVTKLRMLFLDNKDRELDAEGWNVRLRRIEGGDGLELTYKKRYGVEDGRLEAGLERAAREGFDSGEADYKAQVEWGFEKQTLSFTRKKDVDLRGRDEMELPRGNEAVAVAIQRIPGKLDHWKREGWARTILADAHLYGPVKGWRWSGRWEGTKVDFEVWEVRKSDGNGVEPIVELSFKEDDRSKAATRRRELSGFASEKHWLLGRDVLKTKLILDRY